MSSAFLEKGETLILNTLGLEGERSFRKAFDGFTYFGCKKAIKKGKQMDSVNFNVKLTFGAHEKASL